MTIEFYNSAMAAGEPITAEFQGSVLEFISQSIGAEININEPQPVAVFKNDVEITAKDWCTTSCDNVQIHVVPHGFDPFTWALIAGAALAAASLLFRPGIPTMRQQQQGKSLATAEATANIAKPNQTVPELAGRYLRYPDYLVPPRRYFADQRTQFMETLLCIGPGEYDISNVRIGNTEFASLEGTEYRVYPPGANVAAHGMHENWYSAKEVGSTSAGTAGLELTSEPASQALPTGSSYVFNNTGITSDTVWPSAWGQGTELLVKLFLTYSVAMVGGDETSSYSEFTGVFSHIQPLSIGSDITATIDDETYKLRVNTISPDGANYKITFRKEDDEGSYMPWNTAPVGSVRVCFFAEAIRYTVQSLVAKQIVVSSVTDWFGFPAITLPAADVVFEITNNALYGEWVGPFFAMPAGEVASSFQYDLFFPQGLNELSDRGDVLNRSVTVEMAYRAEGSASWQISRKVYSSATMDQIGFTESLSLPQGRYEFRHRRTSAASADTRINDTVQLYGLRSLLRSPISYAGWTTIGVRIRGLGKIGSNSENQINVLATRKLPTLRADSTWGPAVPTRDISAFVHHIMTSVGYSELQLDMVAMQALHNLWASRGDTFDHVFDSGTVRSALATNLRAGMADLTIADSTLVPVREGVRTQYLDSYGFSKQNTLGDIKRTFKTPRPDDNDGVQVEFVSAVDNYTTRTINCLLPGSLGIKLEKLKIEGVTDETQAWRIGMRRASEIAYSRWTYSFDTEMDAFNSNYKDYISIVPDIPEYGHSALCMGARRVESGIEIAITEKLPQDSDFVAWRDSVGKLRGPFSMVRISANTLNAQAGPDVPLPYFGAKMEPAHVYFGTQANLAFPALIERMQPEGNNASVQAVNYDARKYAYDDKSPTGV